MIQLVADSGSTKTNWRLIHPNGQIEQFESVGLNPHFYSVNQVEEVLRDTFQSVEVTAIDKVFFYGAGCSSPESNQLIKDALSRQFTESEINVYHDLLGAARASCGQLEGLAGILGTGSNCCAFDGKEIVESYPSAGFILGDEGGGVHIGKLILKSFFEERMPDDLSQSFEFRYQTPRVTILEHLYKNENPNRYLAGFSHFAFHHREHPFVASMLLEAFDAYFEQQVLRFEQSKKWTLNLVGSVAFYYHEFIREIAQRKKVKVGKIIEKPISGLSLYHSNQLSGD